MTAITQYRETNTLALAAQAMQLLDFGSMLVKSGMLPGSVRTPESAVAIMVKGMELGLPAMAALNGITVIQGKPTVSPQLMLSLINRSGQLENIEIDTGKDGATVTMKRRGRSAFTAKFGPSEAQAMGLNTKDNYKKQAPVMYQWRAVAACARVVFPDVIDGLYTPEEMGADVQVDEDGAMTVQVEQERTPTPRERQSRDVTREIGQAAGTPEHTTRPAVNEEALQAWAKKISDVAERVRKVAPTEEVTIILDMYNWRSDVEAARATYEELKELGKQHAPPPEKVKSDPDVVDGELKPDLITDAQRGTLMAHLKRGGLPDNSETRSQFYTWFTNGAIHHPTRTNELTSEQAKALLVEMATLDTDALAQAVGEFLKAVAA